jgi:hypothetical protein
MKTDSVIAINDEHRPFALDPHVARARRRQAGDAMPFAREQVDAAKFDIEPGLEQRGERRERRPIGFAVIKDHAAHRPIPSCCGLVGM